jgi:hypothetical protein
VIIPTPEEWAQEQLKNAPPRSEEWTKRVARIYCLDIGDDDDDDEKAAQAEHPSRTGRGHVIMRRGIRRSCTFPGKWARCDLGGTVCPCPRA